MDVRELCITAQKTKFSIKDFFSKCGQIRRKLRIWSYLLKKSLMENFIFCAVHLPQFLEKKPLPYFKNIMFYKPEKFWFLHVVKTPLELLLKVDFLPFYIFVIFVTMKSKATFRTSHTTSFLYHWKYRSI